MKRILLASLTLSFSSTHVSENFGKVTLNESAALPLKAALDSYKEGVTTTRFIKGSVKKVCEKEGCWMLLEDQGARARVFFKNHGFFVAQKIKDRPVLAEGVLQKRVRTVAEQKHLLQDAGTPVRDNDAIKAVEVSPSCSPASAGF